MPDAKDALQRLGEVTEELQQLHRELASLLAAEKSARIAAWVESDETTVTARDRVADFNALNLTLDIIKIKGEIAAFEAEVRYLVIVVEHA